jgi:hypothetical protein
MEQKVNIQPTIDACVKVGINKPMCYMVVGAMQDYPQKAQEIEQWVKNLTPETMPHRFREMRAALELITQVE